jgi:hypothetical protein
MSYTGTTRLDLKKADIGSNQPFETSVINANWDKVDAEAVAVDTRIDTIEGTIDGYDSSITALGNDITALDGRLDTAESDIDALQLAVGAGATVRTATGTTDATLSADKGNYVRYTSSSAVTVTVNNVLAAGEYINFVQDGTGAVSFTPGTGVTLNSVSNNRKLSAQYAWASVICVASGSYRLVGSLIA